MAYYGVSDASQSVTYSGGNVVSGTPAASAPTGGGGGGANKTVTLPNGAQVVLDSGGNIVGGDPTNGGGNTIQNIQTGQPSSNPTITPATSPANTPATTPPSGAGPTQDSTGQPVASAPTNALTMAGLNNTPATSQQVDPNAGIEKGVQSVQQQVQELAKNFPAILASLQSSNQTVPATQGQASGAITTAGAAITSANTSKPDPVITASNDFAQGYNSMPPALQMIYGLVQGITNPSSTQQTFSQQYQQVLQQSGLPALQTQYMNIENVINGTANDIRTEITAAGGMATESEVQGMTTARNQTLILQANSLQSAMSMAQDYVDNTMKFSQADQQQVNDSLNQKIGLVETAASMQSTMDSNAGSNYNKTLTALGDNYTAFAATIPPNMQPYVEQTMGLAAGTLSNPKTLATMTSAALKQQTLSLDVQKEQIAAMNAQTSAQLKIAQEQFYGSRGLQASDSAVNSVISQLYPTPASNPINMYQSSSQWVNKLTQAYQSSTDPNNTAKNVSDLELIDAAVKINNGGNQITDTQVNTLLENAGIKAKVQVEADQLTGIGTILTDSQRNTILNLAQDTFSGQESLANSAVSRINTQLANQGFDANYNLPQVGQPQTGQSVIDKTSGNSYIVGTTYNDGTSNWTIDSNGNWSKQ